jgi:hypothetical protein
LNPFFPTLLDSATRSTEYNNGKSSVMNSDQPDEEKEWPLHHPVKIITAQHMAEYYEEMRLNPPASKTGFVSPLVSSSLASDAFSFS